MKLRWVSLICLLIILASSLPACGVEETAIAQMTPTVKVVSSTRTPTPKPTVTSTSTPVPSPTPAPTKTSTPTRTPVPTFVLSALPEIYDASRYQLAVPDSSVLLSRLNEADRILQYYSEYSGSGLPEYGPFQWDLAFEIGKELSYYYPNGLANPSDLFDASIVNLDYFGSSYMPFFDQAILEDLTQQKITETTKQIEGPNFPGSDTPWYESDVYPVALDRDEPPEFVIVSTIMRRYTFIHAIDQATDGTYRGLKLDFGVINGEADFEFDSIRTDDITGDGISDLIIIRTIYRPLYAEKYVDVYKGSASGFSLLSKIATYFDTDLTFMEEEGKYSLKLVHEHDFGQGCIRVEQIIYSWTGGRESVSQTTSMPETLTCRMAQFRDSYIWVGPPIDDVPERIAWYEEILSDFQADNLSDFERLQFARLKLAIFYSMQEQNSATRAMLNSFLNNYQEGDYANEEYYSVLSIAILPSMDGGTVNPLNLCMSLADINENDLPEWRNYLAFDNSGTLDVLSLCPIENILLSTLKNYPNQDEQLTVEMLTAEGLQVILVEPYLFPKADRQSWFVVIEAQGPRLFGYVPAEDGFEWKYFYGYWDTQDLKVYRGDANGDGQEELAIAGLDLSSDTSVAPCPAGRTGFDYFLIASLNAENIYLDSDRVCSETKPNYTIQDFYLDLNHNQVVDTFTPDTDPYFLDNYLYQIQHDSEVWYVHSSFNLNSPPPDELQTWINACRDVTINLWNLADYESARDEMLHLINTAPADYSHAVIDIQKMNYFIGLSYELEGNEEMAIQYFLEVMKFQPQTLWSNLAAAHLQLKDSGGG